MHRNWGWALGFLLTSVTSTSAQVVSAPVGVPGGPPVYSSISPIPQPNGFLSGSIPVASYVPVGSPIPVQQGPPGPVNSVNYAPMISPIEDTEAVVGALRQQWLFESEYLLWWVRNGGQITDGLVGVSSVDDFLANGGRLQNIVPLGGSSSGLDFGAQSGLRVSLTHYFDEMQGCGVDISWMTLYKGELSDRFASSDSILLGPTFNDTDGTRVLVLASFPSTVTINGQVFTQGRAATVSVDTANRLWGAEANLRMRLPNTFFWDRLWLLGGVRSFQYGEGFGVETISTPLPGSNAGDVIELRDSFVARNFFMGPQLGVSARTQIGWFSLDLTGKTSLGALCEEVKITGDTIISGPQGRDRLVGGVLAQRTNIGTLESTRMAWVNELSVKGGWNFTDSIRATVGYSLLHSNRMVRVSGAVDTVDSRGVQVLGTFDPTFTPTQPALTGITESYWWVQGLTFGVDWSF